MGSLWNEYADVATVVSPVPTVGTNTSRLNFRAGFYRPTAHIYVVL